MPLSIENRGSGFIGELGDSWRVSLTTVPANVGDGAGKLGALSFSARCNSDTKFTIDNYLSVQHYADDGATRFLSTFDVYLRRLETNGEFGSFSGVSILSALDVDRVASNDTAGVYQRTFELPSQVEYDVGGTTYYTGGYYTTVGGQSVWVEQEILTYDITVDEDFVYVLASGGHNGEVVFRFYCDGVFQMVFPVYSDATDIAAPDARSISAAGNYVVVGQQAAKRVKMFDGNGNFVRQFGAAGSADGQFQSINGVAISEVFSSVFVTDSVLSRVQRFNKLGTYQNKWGAFGTGSGALEFVSPNGIAIDPITEHVFVADMRARVRVYDSFGNLQSQPMGAYDFVNGVSIGEFTKTRAIGLGFDQRGNAYAFQDGNIHMYSRTTNLGWFYGSQRVKSWTNHGTGTFTNAGTVDFKAGHMYYATTNGSVESFAATPGSLGAFLNYYIALATPDFPIQYLAMNKPYGSGPYPFIGWEDNVWHQLCDLCASTDNAIAAFDDKIIVFNRADRTFKLPVDAVIDPVEFDSAASGRSIEVVNQNADWTNTAEVIYNSVADDRRVFSIDINGLAYHTLEQGLYPQIVYNPTPGSTAASGVYTIRGQDNTAIDPTEWTRKGGSVTATIGPEPGTILLKIVGPASEPGGIEGPYRLVDVAGAPTLTLVGCGVRVTPETYRIGTGVSEAVTGTEVARTIDSPFVWNAAIAYTEGGWGAYNAGTPFQKVKISIKNDRGFKWSDSSTGIGGTFQFSGVVVYHDESEYLIDSAQYDRSTINLTGYRYNRASHASSAGGEPGPRVEEIWNTYTADRFDVFWRGYTAQDFTIAPLRNPNGYYAEVL